MTAPAGVVTRGTTAPRRLRRVDRWLLDTRPGLVRRDGLVAVDLGFGATPVTTVEMARQLHAVNPTARVVGVDIDPQRVAAAAPASRPGLEFRCGGFELDGVRADVVRAFNVLRQYDERDVAAAWQLMAVTLSGPHAVILDGTCDESGGLGAWVTLTATGPRALTLILDPSAPPGAVAARLPKVLIHRNVAGEGVHRLLAELGRQWQAAAPLRVFSPRQRMAAAITALARSGWPVLDGPARWRRCEVTVPWAAVAPRTIGNRTVADIEGVRR